MNRKWQRFFVKLFCVTVGFFCWDHIQHVWNLPEVLTIVVFFVVIAPVLETIDQVFKILP